MKQTLLLLVLLWLPSQAAAELTALIPEATIAAIAGEVSGVSAKRNLDAITLYHRTRASSQFRAAAEHVRERLLAYGIAEAEILEYPADGKTMFGTQKSRPAWEVEFAELWELDASDEPLQRHGSWEALPLSLAQDSVSAKVTAALVDIGPGQAETDYAGKDLRGKLVLTSSQPSAVAELAVGKLGAAGIISYAPNQKSAWWLEDDRLVRWGHLDSFSSTKTFGFMVSLKTARSWRARLAAGETIRFAAEVRATQSGGKYSLVSARIPGTDPAVAGEEIIFSCHLDHPRPGANDNASGCVSILEAARTLQALIDRGALPAPRRSLRFIWPAEIEGSLIYLASMTDTSHLKANIHLDMVGGGEVTKAVFRISAGPLSIPSFVGDVGHEIGRFVNRETLLYASGEPASYPLVAREGSRNPQRAVLEGLSNGSDHDVFNSGSWGVPGIYLHDWPDRYIHTNFDLAANIDPTKLKRAAFISALQGWYLANLGDADVPALVQLLRVNSLERSRQQLLLLDKLPERDRASVQAVFHEVELGKLASIEEFAVLSQSERRAAQGFLEQLNTLLAVPQLPQTEKLNQRVYQRNPSLQGTMFAFGYSYLEEHLPVQRYQGLALSGETAYEALNLVNGKRSVSDIRDWLQAEFGPLALADLADYLAALEQAGVLL